MPASFATFGLASYDWGWLPPKLLGRSKEAGMRRSAHAIGVAEHIVNAALAPDEWTLALEAMTNLLHADHAMIIARERASGRAFLAKSARMDEECFNRFLAPEASRWMEPLQQAMPRGTAVTSSRLVTDRELERSELHNEVVRLANGFYAVGYRQDFSALSTFVAVFRPRRKGGFATRDTWALQNLAPLLGTTLELQYRLHVCEQQRAALANVLDKLNRAVMVTDASTRPIFLNKEAERLVAEDDGLSAGCAQLSAAMPAATRRLRDAVLETAAHGPVKGRRLRLERPSGRGPLLLTVLPSSRLGMAPLDASAPRVVIFVDELDQPAAIDRAAIADIFDLTPRESEVATRLAGGSDLTTISGALRMSYSTVRTHLLHVFEKTGVHNQAALVALLSRFRKLLVFIPGTSISRLPEMLSHLADAATW